MKQFCFSILIAFSLAQFPVEGSCQEPFSQSELPISQAQKEGLEQFLARKHEEKLRQQRYRSNSFTMNVLDAGIDNPKILELMELTEEQKKEIEKLVSSFRDKRNKINENLQESDDIEEILERKMLSVKAELREKVCDLLVDFQMEDISQMNVLQIGIPHVLLDSKIGDAMELTEKQRANIKMKSDRLAKKLEKTIRESRQEAYKAVFSELNKEQKEFLVKLYGKPVILNYCEEIDIPTIFRHFRFYEKDPPNYFAEPVRRTEIPELHSSRK